MLTFHSKCVLVAVVALALPSMQRRLSVMDIQNLVDQLGDEILTHQGLNAASSVIDNIHDLDKNTVDDMDDDEIPHPKGIHNWASILNLGQVSGVAVNPDDEPVVFHRGGVVWDGRSFDQSFRLRDRTPIPNNTILTLDPDSGEIKSAFGAGMFHMPHGITVDGAGNVYVTDTGLHQVMRFPPGATKPDLVLGEAFTPGKDDKHFCQPTAVAVSDSTGVFFVADGYCNSRIMKFNRDGKLISVVDGSWKVPHSLALFEDEDVLCVADRDGQRIDCVRAGLMAGSSVAGATANNAARPGSTDDTGKEVVTYTGLGRPYGIASKGTTLLAVCEPAPGSGVPVRGITIDTAADQPRILDQWGIDEGLSHPHAVAISQTGDAVYVAEIDMNPKKKDRLHKFEVVRFNDGDLSDW